MADEWFYAQQGRQLGPVSFESLAALFRNRHLSPTDLVWRQGMPSWVEARTLPELAQSNTVLPLIDAPQPQPAVQPMQYETPRGIYYDYAGFWLRFVAALIDGILLAIPIAILSWVADQAMGMPVFRPRGPAVFFGNLGNLWQILIYWLYFAFMESSEYQATLGKMALGLIVTDENGGRISFGRASGRSFAKYISQIICMIGYIMAGFTERKQALHDMIAQTLVVRKGVPRP